MKKRLSLVPALILLVGFASATSPFSGVAPYSSQTGGPFDSIDLANNNLVITIPVREKIGKIPFSFSLTRSTSAFSAQYGQLLSGPTSLDGAVGHDLGSSVTWVTTPNYDCGQGQGDTLYSNFSVRDASGAVHPLNPTWELDSKHLCFTQTSYSGYVGDGTGYYATVSYNSGLHWTLYDRSGDVIAPGSVTDPDGVAISYSVTTQGNVTTTTYADTLDDTNHHVLIAAVTAHIYSGNDTFTYKDYNDGSQVFTVKYKSYTQVTNFRCSGLADISQTQRYMPYEIDVPGGSVYSITYEQTPGYTGNGQYGQYTTGRLAGLSFPSGGWITYAYAGGGNNAGLDCYSFAVPTLTRTVHDNNGNSSPWVYTNTNSSILPTNFTATVTDPNNNQTLYYFAGEYETAYYNYAGSITGGTFMSASVTCYNGVNGQESLCIQPTSQPSLPFTQVDKYSYVFDSAGSTFQRAAHTVKLDQSSGLPTEEDSYDFGATFPLSSSTPVSKTLISYGTWNGTCVALSNARIIDRRCAVQVLDGSNHTYKLTHNSYDGSTGHLTSSSAWVSGSNYLTTSYAYSGGVLSSLTEPNNAVTHFDQGGYSCNGILSNQTNLQTVNTTITTSQAWNCNGGVTTSETDANGKVTSYSYVDSGGHADPLWRLLKISFADSGSTTITYNTGATSPWTITTNSDIDGTNSVSKQSTLDGLGREITATNLSSSPSIYVVTTYDNMGRVHSVTNPYYITSDGATTTSYDAISRPTVITNQDSTQTNLYYNLRAAKVVDAGNNYGNSSHMTKVYQRDGLGRLVSVCDYTTVQQKGGGYGTPGACNDDYGLTGFPTFFQYDAVGRLTQTYKPHMNYALFSYDGLDRKVTDEWPDEGSGITTYTYDNGGQQGDLYTRTRPAANQGSYSTLTTTTYTYDKLHRLTYIGYSGETGVTTQPVGISYDLPPSWLPQATNLIGRMVTAFGAGGTAGTAYSYDSMGRTIDEWQCTPKNCGLGSFQLHSTYNRIGELTSFKNYADGVTYSYSYDQAPNLTSVTSSKTGIGYPATLFSSTSANHNAWGEVVSSTNGDNYTTTYTYDHRGRMLSKSVGTNGAVYNLSLQYAGNGNVAEANNSVNGDWSYVYDDFNRLTASCLPANFTTCPNHSSTTSYQYLYDQFGNRWNQDLWAGTGYTFDISFNTNNTSNQIAGSQGFGYDAAGNITATPGPPSHTYKYDAENRLVQIDGTYSTTYDPLGRDVEDNFSGTSDWVYSGENPIWGCALFNSTTGACLTSLPSEFYLAGSQFSTYVMPPSGQSPSGIGGTYFNYGDQVGSRRVRTQVSATLGTVSISGTMSNLAFGDGMTTTGSDPDTMDFTGQRYDVIDSLTHFTAREYSMTQGRWMVPDPFGAGAVNMGDPQTWNRYAYVGNSPTSASDPLGLFIVDCSWDACTHGNGGGNYGGGSYMDGYMPTVGLLGRNAAAAEAAWLGSGSIPWYSFNASGQLMIRVWNPSQHGSSDEGFTITVTTGGWKWVPVPGGQSNQGSTTNGWTGSLFSNGLVFWKMKNKLVDSGPLNKNFRQPPEKSPVEEILEALKEKADKVKDAAEALLEIIKNLPKSGTFVDLPLFMVNRCITNPGQFSCEPEQKP